MRGKVSLRLVGALIFALALLALAAMPGRTPASSAQELASQSDSSSAAPAAQAGGTVTHDIQKIAPHVFRGDVRNLPRVPSKPKPDFDLKEPRSTKQPPPGQV